MPRWALWCRGACEFSLLAGADDGHKTESCVQAEGRSTCLSWAACLISCLADMRGLFACSAVPHGLQATFAGLDRLDLWWLHHPFHAGMESCSPGRTSLIWRLFLFKG